ncbi:MAG: ammonium transporter, partial [Leptospiraceae bacterium]|nr:ammonium transporter [Leptospiraceae bacterium]
MNSLRSEMQIYKESMSKKVDSKEKELDLLWLCIASFLVFFMQAGFALVEAGFTREKNTVNILMKNLMDFSMGTLSFWMIGFGIMFGPQIIKSVGVGALWGEGNLSFSSLTNSEGMPDASIYAFFLFQCVFAGTATTIASGAMAERTKFVSYLIYSIIMTGLIYPIFGSFSWRGLTGIAGEEQGFLEAMGFVDFAGSTVVHSIGGWAGLAGTLI